MDIRIHYVLVYLIVHRWYDRAPNLQHWNRVILRPGTQCPVLGSATTAGADASHRHQYRLQQHLILLAWIFDLFSSSDEKVWYL